MIRTAGADETVQRESMPAALSWNESVRVGFIELSTSITVSAEVPEALPANVKPLLTRLRLPGGEVSADALGRMVDSDRLEQASRELADGGARVVAFACTTGSLIKGAGFDRELVERMERASGARATTTATALLAALSAIGARTVAVATPYVDELNDLEARFLEAQGFEVTALRGLGIGSDPEIARVPYARTRELVLAAVADGGDPDAVFVSCTNLPTLALLDRLVRELGKRVFSSVAVTIWHTLALAGIGSSSAGAGSLLAGAAVRDRVEERAG
jgi:maleate isomerase